MTATALELGSSEAWKKRVRLAVADGSTRPLVFVLGDGVARDAGGGVWSVADILRVLLEEHGIQAATIDGTQGPLGEIYGRCLGKLKQEAGGRGVSRLFRRAVLKACAIAENDTRVLDALEGKPGSCQRLEQLDQWHLPAGIVALGKILGKVQSARALQTPSALAPLILTTNFDPLIEVALRQQSVPCQTFSFVTDRKPDGTGDQVEVWHLHGTWSDVTMHTPTALRADRPKLKDALKRRLDGADICVLGYGGWDDVVFSTVSEILKDGSFAIPPEVVWAFYEPTRERVVTESAHVLERLSGSLAACQVAFYSGIDANAELPEIAGLIIESRPAAGGDCERTPQAISASSAARHPVDSTPRPQAARLPLSGNLLGSGRAEQDALLDLAFVQTAEYQSLTHSADFHVVVGRRGTGKSALFRKVREFYQDRPGVITITAAVEEHISLSVAHRLASVCATYEHARAVMRIVWKIAILSQVAVELFEGINLRIPKTADWLPEHLRTVDVVRGGGLHRTIEKLLSSAPAANIQEMASEVAKKGRLDRLQNLVRDGLERVSKRTLILVDRLDEGWGPDPIPTGVIGGLIAAGTDLAEQGTHIHLLYPFGLPRS